MKRRRSCELNVSAADRRNLTNIHRNYTIRSTYAKFAALRRFIVQAPDPEVRKLADYRVRESGKRAGGALRMLACVGGLYRDIGVVVCSGEEDAVSINWMYLYKGEPRRCQCGYWFKLTELEVPDYAQ